MTALFPARRSAEEFARVVDGTADERESARFEQLERTVALLERHPVPEQRPEFATELRARLMAAADTVLVPAVSAQEARLTLPARTPRPRERRIAVAAAALVLVGGTAGVAAAAQSSSPGQALYPVKRGIEQARIALSTNDASRGQTYLDDASSRVDDVRTLVGEGSSARQAALLTSTLDDFSSSASQGANLLFAAYRADPGSTDLTQVRSFTARQMAALEALRQQAPASTGDSFANAANVLADIDQQARTLCVSCGSAGPLALPDGLLAPTSAGTFARLVTEPAAPLPIAPVATSTPNLDAAASEAAKAAAAAANFPPPSSSSSTSGSQGGVPTGSGQAAQTVTGLVQGLTSGADQTTAPVTSAVTGAVKGTVKKATDGLAGATGGQSSTLTDPLTGAVNGLLP